MTDGNDRITFVSRRIYGEPGVGPYRGFVSIHRGLIEATGAGAPCPGGKIVDVGDLRIIPGLIDLHVHGALGLDVLSDERWALSVIAGFLAQHGTTAFQPTAGSAPPEVLERVIGQVKDACTSSPEGARALGLHLEGPFLNPGKKGAMPEEHLMDPSMDTARKWVTDAGGTLRQVTLAPELSGALEVTRYLASCGTTVSAGHTCATYQAMLEGFRAGVTVATHTFNAMEGFHHRKPGALGAVLTEPGVTCEILGDCVHVHPAAIRLLVAAKGPGRACLISDLIPPAGMPAGEYLFLGHKVQSDGIDRCILTNGTLAGSITPLNKCLQRMVEVAKVPFEIALSMATLNPARVCGVEGRKGTLAPGKDADLVVLDDDYNAVWSIVEGKIRKSPDV